MKNQRRSRPHGKRKAATGAFTAPGRARAFALGSAPRPTRLPPIVETWRIPGIPDMMLSEDGTMTRAPNVTMVLDRHTRMIMGWHVS
jgi:hypothetical protein